LSFAILGRWKFERARLWWIGVSRVMITIVDMIAVERTSQIHQICKLVILTGESFGCALCQYFMSGQIGTIELHGSLRLRNQALE
jgi:hypothetical protein